MHQTGSPSLPHIGDGLGQLQQHCTLDRKTAAGVRVTANADSDGDELENDEKGAIATSALSSRYDGGV